ncbi:hypothetical protein SKAU_G00180940 [Synaphobranchus kaupii]|uniref:Uncharacterized protein n=1 Tax=Synaphobranchus kaupii TaxID=118154 RepID=A0A9Q1FMX6_SYNKA|nr:hypothetical protein SKAU_G00180940 [Synaphobranchus kaupii]
MEKKGNCQTPCSPPDLFDAVTRAVRLTERLIPQSDPETAPATENTSEPAPDSGRFVFNRAAAGENLDSRPPPRDFTSTQGARIR